MGNNAAFTSFEASVIAVYNKGVLDRELLDALAAPYDGLDVDRGGMEGTLTRDGLDIDGVILKIYGVSLSPQPELPRDHRQWTPDQYQANEEWHEKRWEALQPIEKGWGWR